MQLEEHAFQDPLYAVIDRENKVVLVLTVEITKDVKVMEQLVVLTNASLIKSLELMELVKHAHQASFQIQLNCNAPELLNVTIVRDFKEILATHAQLSREPRTTILSVDLTNVDQEKD